MNLYFWAYSWFAMTSSEIEINEFIDKIFTQYKYSLVLKGPCKFQVDIPIDAGVLAVQSLENFYTWQPCWLAQKYPPALFPI